MTYSNHRNQADEFPPFFIHRDLSLNKYLEHVSNGVGISLFLKDAIDNGASLRKYWVLQDNNDLKYVLSLQGDNYQNFIKYSEILSQANIRTPEIIFTDSSQKTILQQYLPDNCSLLYKQQVSSTELKYITLLLKKYRSIDQKHFPRSFFQTVFDKEWYDLIVPILWDDQISLLMQNELYPILKSAFSVEEFPGHRDFQSSNLYFFGNHFYVIDFQDSMLLHPCYDIASFVWDSYVSLNFPQRMVMAKQMLNEDLSHYTYEDFLLVSLQRKLHDLAAFIRAVKNNKMRFAKYLRPTMAMIDQFLIELKIDVKFEELWQSSRIQEYLSLLPDSELD